MWSGLSNQSRDRKRRGVRLAVKTDLVLGQAGNIYAYGEEAASQGLVGAVLVTLSDIVAREAFPPSQLPAGAGAFLGIAVAEVLDVGSSTANGTMLPVGVVTGIVGGPYLLWLLATQIRKGTM